MGINLPQLRYLVALAKDENFTRAAERCHVAQPAFSRQIRRLEEELGIVLVDRTTRRVRLTAAGLEFATRAAEILAELDAARDHVSRHAALEVGRLEVGLTPTPGPFDAARVLGQFRRNHPGIELALREALSVELAELLRRDELDVAIVSAISTEDRHGLTLEPIAAEPLEAVVAPQHRLSSRRQVHLRELLVDDFVSFPAGATIRAAIELIAEREDATLTVAFESGNPARVRQLVHEGLGVAVLPLSDAAAPGAKVARLSLRDSELQHEVFVAWRARRRLSPPTDAFVAELPRPIRPSGKT